MKVRLLYFAWVREKTGRGEETLELPASIRTVGELVRWQKQRAPEFGEAFANEDAIRVALDQEHAQADSPLSGAREIAFFPPVTGG
jgi:molybdopterin synthase sulfur carrier subunit